MQLGLFDAPIQNARYTPREYQARGINRVLESWEQNQAGALFRLCTGGGKTFCGSMLADMWLQRGSDYRVMVLAHERQLIQQFAEEIEEFLGIQPAIEMGDRHCTGREEIIVASRQTLQVRTDKRSGYEYSRLNKFDPALNWLLIIDEAHRWAYKLKSCAPILDHFGQNPNSKRLGLTATPERTDKTRFDKLFPCVASDYRLYDLQGGPCAVNDGWAVPYDQRFITVEGVDFKNLPEVAKDFDRHELERILSEDETLASLCQPMIDLVGERRTLIFSPGVDMAKAVAMYLNANLGWEAAVSLDGSYPDDERKDVYRRHQSGDFQFLSVCGLCREGYNDPGIGAVAIFRPTKSRPLAEQMKGRGCRPLRGIVDSDMTSEERIAAIAASDKPNCMIIDLVGITGLADCASTAHILADGIPDEVIQRANENALKKDGADMAEEIIKAQEEIEEEERLAKQAREEALQAKLKRLEDERRAREEALKRARLNKEVTYHEQQVQVGQGGKQFASSKIENGASDKQIKYIGFLGLDVSDVPITKAQAGRIITQLNEGMTIDEVKRKNRLPSTAGVALATAAQVGYMRRLGIKVPEGCTKRMASELIDQRKRVAV